MTVRYEENSEGMFWVDGDEQGEPQKDLHHAMKDYERVCAGKAVEVARQQREEQRVHTGNDGGPTSRGALADSLGSAGENQEANRSANAEGTGGSSGVSDGDSSEADGGGSSGSEGPDDPEE